MTNRDRKPLEIPEALAALAANSDYRVLRRLAITHEHVFDANVNGEACARLAIIDTETTGLMPDRGARIIDLAIATCEYGLISGNLYRVVDRYESLEDPEEPIPPEITRLTGITDDMVRGHHIDEAGIARAIDRVGLCVCHNASFDRAFLESRFPTFARKRFACSLNELPWEEWNINSAKLDYVGYRFGLFHDAHRARADVDMLLALLAQQAPGADGTILSRLLASARAPSWRIHAIGLPIENKDYASARGYHWNDGSFKTPKAWWIETRDEKAERDFLAGVGCKKPLVIEQTAFDRYRPLAVRVAEELDHAVVTADPSPGGP